MNQEPATVTATMAAMRDSRLRAAVQHVMHRLRNFVRAIPERLDDPMPPHHIEWFVETDDGPEKQLASAMKLYPVLWLRSLPDEVIVVRRDSLAKATSPHMVDVLAMEGVATVETRAAHLQQQEIEDYHRMARAFTARS